MKHKGPPSQVRAGDAGWRAQLWLQAVSGERGPGSTEPGPQPAAAKPRSREEGAGKDKGPQRSFGPFDTAPSLWDQNPRHRAQVTRAVSSAAIGHQWQKIPFRSKTRFLRLSDPEQIPRGGEGTI